MSPEQLAIEIAKHLSRDGLTLDQAKFWCRVAETFSDDEFEGFLRMVSAISSPASLILRKLVQVKARSEAHVQ